MGTTTKALIYTRASMDRKMLKRSTTDQEVDCRAWCDHEGWTVAKVITDANRSASQWRTREREGFEEALLLIQSKQFDAFVTWEPSRAGREMLAYVQLRAACQEAGVLYLTKGRVYDFSRSDDAFMMGLEFLTAEKDAATIRDRQLRTVRLNAEKGRPHGRLPYGYRRVYDDRTGVLLRQEIDPEEAQVIIDAVDTILDGGSVSALVTRFNLEGRPIPQGARKDTSAGWVASSLRSMLTNPTIAGLRVYQGEVIGEAGWPGIIPVERWKQLCKILRDPARRIHRFPVGNPSHPKWLLSHVARCQFCGRPIARIGEARDRSKRPARRQYGCVFTGCRKVSIGMTGTDNFVVGTLMGWLSTPANIAILTSQGDDWADRITAAEQRLAELQHRLDEAKNKYVSGEIDMNLLLDLQKRLTPQIEAATAATVPPISDQTVRALVSGNDVEQAWESLELLEKRRLLKLLLDIRIGPAKKMGGQFQTDRIHISPRIGDPTMSAVQHYSWTP